MKRREFLQKSLTGLLSNKSADTLQSETVTSGIGKYSGEWNRAKAAHLLRRTLYGFDKAMMDKAVSDGRDKTLDMLFTEYPTPDPPVYIAKDDSGYVYGETWVDKPLDPNYERKKVYTFLAWWFGNIASQPASLQHKMTVFWHNHFVTETTMVKDSRFIYKYWKLLYDNSLGNFQRLAEQITIDPAMLIYLNGNTSTNKAPNENYARELMELFTVGKGPLIEPGNYTNYTEDDVQAAAKVLTGWINDNKNIGSLYVDSRHYKGNKYFSEAFNHQTISNAGEDEYKKLIEMIFAQKETARFIVRKFYRWFVYYNIDDTIAQNVIEPLADALIANNFDIKPVLRMLFESEHFYDVENIGAMIKDPIDFVASFYKSFGVQFPTSDPVEIYYTMWYTYGYALGYVQGMALGDPPNVAGWSEYYQIPMYYRLWANSVTLPDRKKFTDAMIYTGLKYKVRTLVADTVEFAKTLDNPGNAHDLITESAEIFLSIELTDKQKDYLLAALLGDVPDYEWNAIWSDYIKKPTDDKKASIEPKLKNLYLSLFAFAEYQLM